MVIVMVLVMQGDSYGDTGNGGDVMYWCTQWFY